MNRSQLFDGLDFHNHRIFHDQIETIPTVKSYIFVNDR